MPLIGYHLQYIEKLIDLTDCRYYQTYIGVKYMLNSYRLPFKTKLKHISHMISIVLIASNTANSADINIQSPQHHTPTINSHITAPSTHIVKKLELFHDMKPNSVKFLGKFNCPSYLPEEGKRRCIDLLAYSGFVYNPHTGLMTQFGGGHSATSNNSLNYYSYNEKKWKSYYKPTPCSEMTKDNFDKFHGRWRTDNMPAARHTTDCIIANKLRNEFIILKGTGVKGNQCGFSAPEKTSIASFDIKQKKWSYTNFIPPWKPSVMTEQDPISGNILIIGKRKAWIYSPVSRIVLKEQMHKSYDINITQTLLYSNYNDRFYIIKGHHGYGLYKVKLDRKQLNISIERVHDETGILPPIRETGTYAYSGFGMDTKNHKIIGMRYGIIYAYDIPSNNWEQLTPVTTIKLGSVKANSIAYDPINNIFLIVDTNKNVIAYRYK